MGPEGWKVRQQHFETVTTLVRASRAFFPEGAAAQIWSEFRFGCFFLAYSAALFIFSPHTAVLFCCGVFLLVGIVSS
jgi:hypothetical protein